MLGMPKPSESHARLANVWAGDVVQISKVPFRVPPVGLLGGVIVAAGAVYAALASGVSWPPNIKMLPEGAVLAGCVVLGLIVELVASGDRRRRAQAVADASLPIPLTHGMLIRRQSLGLMPSQNAVHDWLAKTGPHGPRVICIDVRLEPFPACEPVNEEIDLGPGRAIGGRERRSRWAWMIGAAFVAAITAPIAIVVKRNFPSDMQVFLTIAAIPVVALGVVIISAYRLGVRPVIIAGGTAVPGSVWIPRRSGVVEFARTDSVLVLRGDASVVDAMLARADGQFEMLQFASGTSDPALRELVSKWCWRGGAGHAWAGRPTREDDPIGS